MSTEFNTQGSSTGRIGASTLFSFHSRRFRLVILVLTIAIACPILLSGLNYAYSHYLEFTPPSIAVFEQPRALGLLPQRLHIKISDSLTGLESLSIELKQGEEIKHLFTQQFKDQFEFEKIF